VLLSHARNRDPFHGHGEGHLRLGGGHSALTHRTESLVFFIGRILFMGAFESCSRCQGPFDGMKEPPQTLARASIAA